MKNLTIIILLCTCLFSSISAQTTSFNYQGSLKNGGVNANGNYDFEFALFDALSGGTQLGSTLAKNSVAVTDGVFTVSLDFGSQFPGAARFLEIRVRPTGQPGITTLGPRQALGSSPYSVKSLNADTATNATNAVNATNATNATTATTATNATQLGGIAANQYVLTGDVRLSDARTPLPGSSNYIQNQNAAPQAFSNFSISGNGTAGGTLQGNIVRAETQFNLGVERILSSPNGTQNLFAGIQAGGANTTGTSNSFFGWFAGGGNTTGNFNSFFGQNAGNSNSTGLNLTMIGAGANVFANGLTNATAIGANATVSASNSLVLGSINGFNGASADTNVGVGTTAPAFKLDVRSPSGIAIYGRSTSSSPVGVTGVAVAPSTNFGTAYIGSTGVWGTSTTSVGVFGTSDSNVGVVGVSNSNIGVLGRSATGNAGYFDGTVVVATLGTAGSTALCRNASAQISTCSSSLRYKSNIEAFAEGLGLIRQLKPITFDWKTGGMHDLGLGAEDVAKVEPLLVTYNDKGQVEGVKYDRVGVVLINAVKEQQAQIESLQKQIQQQRAEIDELKRRSADIDALKALVCSQNPLAEACRPKK